MDTMMKSIITEKDLLRQILLLEELSNIISLKIMLFMNHIILSFYSH